MQKRNWFSHFAKCGGFVLLLVVLFACSNETEQEASPLDRLGAFAEQLEAMENTLASEAVTKCIDPVSAISEKITLAAEKEGLKASFKTEFIELLRQCHSIYQQELELLGQSFADLPDQSQCKQQAQSFVKKQQEFSARIEKVKTLPFTNKADRLAAGRTISAMAVAVVADLGGLQLHRAITCPMEMLLPAAEK